MRDFEGQLGHALPSAKAILKAPWNTRFLLFHIAAARLPDTGNLVCQLDASVMADRQAGWEAPLNFAQGLFNAALAYGNTSRLEEVERVLGELRQLQQKFPDQPEIALRLAKGLVNAAVAYGNASRLEDVERVLGELRQLQGNFGDRADIAACYARAVIVARRLDIHTDSLQKEINRLFQAFGETEEFAPLGEMLKSRESGPENHAK